MKMPLTSFWPHILRIYLFKHTGEGLPTQRNAGLHAFALGCLAFSLICQFAVLALVPENFTHLAPTERMAAVLVLYIPALCGYALQRPENIFSLCLLYAGFSFGGVLGALLVPVAGEIGAWVSLGLAAWAILAYLGFTPSKPNSECHLRKT